jgi:hypothetical protein
LRLLVELEERKPKVVVKGKPKEVAFVQKVFYKPILSVAAKSHSSR